MRTLRTSPLWLAALFAFAAGVALFAVPGAVALAPAALIPPQLQALEMKMEQLQITSERFSEVSRGFALGSPNRSSSGKPERLIRTSLDETVLGEVSASPPEGVLFLNGERRPSLIAIGSTVYQYRRLGSHAHGHRLWVRSRSSHESPVAQLLYMHGGGPLEVDAGGTGPFAGLINLLTTAGGPVSLDGPASVRGQSTTEFTAAVEPLLLIKGLAKEDPSDFKTKTPIETLHVFLAESGWPIRVVALIQTHYLKTTTTVEMLAVNAPVHVKPPPAAQTIGLAQLKKQQAREGDSGTSEFTFTAVPG